MLLTNSVCVSCCSEWCLQRDWDWEWGAGSGSGRGGGGGGGGVQRRVAGTGAGVAGRADRVQVQPLAPRVPLRIRPVRRVALRHLEHQVRPAAQQHLRSDHSLTPTTYLLTLVLTYLLTYLLTPSLLYTSQHDVIAPICESFHDICI